MPQGIMHTVNLRQMRTTKDGRLFATVLVRCSKSPHILRVVVVPVVPVVAVVVAAALDISRTHSNGGLNGFNV